MGEIIAWREELKRQHLHPAFAVPSPTINLGHIHGGDSANRICGNCELHLDLRVLPGMAADLVLLDGDPLADIRNTRRISSVMLGGEWVR